MRTLTGVSRLFMLATIVVAAVLVMGGAYFIGYVGQLERELSGAQSAPARAASQVAIIQDSLGHAGFLKSYRDYWMGDAQAQRELVKSGAEASRAAGALRNNAAAAGTVREIQALVASFAKISAAAPATPPSGLRGVADDSVRALPNPAQLETMYLTLSTSLARLDDLDRGERVSALGAALDRAQTIIIVALAALVGTLIAVAWAMRSRVIHPLSLLERSLASAVSGSAAQRVWGTDRPDEIGELARAGEAMRRRIAETPTAATREKTAPDKGQADVTLEGPALVLFEKLTSQVASAVEALRSAGEAAKQNHAAFAQGQDRILQSNDDMRAAIMAELKTITDAINGAAEQMRGEVTRLIEHIDEERLLPSRAGGAMALLTGPGSEAARTLADVPKAEVLERLGDLAAEMHAVANPSQGAASTALRIEQRARGLFAELGDVAELGADQELSLEGATADVEALAQAVAKLEARAEALSELAVARRFDGPGNIGSPAELSDRAFAADLRTDGAIQTVFEAIERLNNIAAALARAGDAERQRRAIS